MAQSTKPSGVREPQVKDTYEPLICVADAEKVVLAMSNIGFVSIPDKVIS